LIKYTKEYTKGKRNASKLTSLESNCSTKISQTTEEIYNEGSCYQLKKDALQKISYN
jgi:hypothetical protein